MYIYIYIIQNPNIYDCEHNSRTTTILKHIVLAKHITVHEVPKTCMPEASALERSNKPDYRRRRGVRPFDWSKILYTN